MPNERKPAEKMRPDPGKRQTGQDDHEGSPHSPEEFKDQNPAKQGLGPKPQSKKPSGQG